MHVTTDLLTACTSGHSTQQQRRILLSLGCRTCDKAHTLQNVCLIQQKWQWYGLTLQWPRRPDIELPYPYICCCVVANSDEGGPQRDSLGIQLPTPQDVAPWKEKEGASRCHILSHHHPIRHNKNTNKHPVKFYISTQIIDGIGHMLFILERSPTSTDARIEK